MRRIALASLFLCMVQCVSPLLNSQDESLQQEPISPDIKQLMLAARDTAENGNVTEALDNFTKGFAQAKRKIDVDAVTAVCSLVAVNLFEKGNARAGEEVLDLAISHFNTTSDNVRLEMMLQIGAKAGEKYQVRATTVKYLRQLAAYYTSQGDSEHEAAALARILDGMDLTVEEIPMDVTLRLQKLYAESNDRVGSAMIDAALAAAKERNGNIDEALKLYESALDGFRQKEDTPGLRSLLSHVASLLSDRRDYTTAAKYLEDAARLDSAEHENHELSIDLFNLALAYQHLGQIDQAIRKAEDSLMAARASGTRSEIGHVLAGTASLYGEAGKLDLALRYVDEALVIAREDGLADLKLEARQALAMIRNLQGNSINAAADLDVAADISRTQSGLKATAQELRSTAIALLLKGDADAALPKFLKAVEQAKAENDLSELCQARDGLAEAYGHKGDFSSAESPLVENLQFYEQQHDTKEIVRTLPRLATVYVGLGRYYDALDRYAEMQRLLASAEGIEMLQARLNSLLAVSDIYLHLQRYPEARDAANQVLDRSAGAGFREYAGRAERLFGRIYLARRDFEAAKTHFVNAYQIDGADLVFNEGLVEVYLATHRSADALEELSKVKKENLEHAGADLKSRFYAQRGLAHFGAGHFDNAQDDFNEAISTVEYARLDVVGQRSFGYLDAGEYGGRIRAYRGMMEIFGTFEHFGLKGKIVAVGDEKVELPIAALHFAELARGRSQFDSMLSARYEALNARIPKALQDDEARIVRDREHLRSEWEALNARGEHPGPEQVATLQRLQDDAGKHLRAVRNASPQAALTLGPGIAGIESLVLTEHEVVLVYAIGLRSVFLFVVRKGQIEMLALQPTIEDLSSEVQTLRNQMASKQFPRALARKLYYELLGQAEKYLKPDDSVFIAPDGFLGLLPFEALIPESSADAAETTFFGTRYPIAYVHSVSTLALARLAGKPFGDKPLFAIADPVFDASDPRYQQTPSSSSGTASSSGQLQEPAALGNSRSVRGKGYRRLPATRDEVGAIASIMQVKPAPPDVLMDWLANKASFLKTDLGSYRFIHLATHAAALGELGRVNEPFLVLGLPESSRGSQAGVRFEDQIVRLSEVRNLKLSARLVVLAACDTGGGDILQGDGVASLASAFLYAGADEVLLSLWELPSDASVFFMQNFYGSLKQGHSEIEALRLSRAKMRDRYPDPYYWAVFVLYETGSQ
ncbi:MAG TPA: CHAT domain-containing protein [Candidatus Sulfotelmatobacter sp.]|nr:CHAT domain-containing protein [Candidatus Sulfotelmatobacter sp.]